MPMRLKTRKYYQLLQDLNAKRQQTKADNVRFVGALPKQLIPEVELQKDPEASLVGLVKLSIEDMNRIREEKASLISPLEVLQGPDDEEGWEPFCPGGENRSKL